MSTSIFVVGFKPPDDKWKKNKAVWDACKQAGIKIPKEIEEYFDWRDPDPAGVEVKIKASEYTAEDIDGLEVDLTKLPKDVTTLKFCVSYQGYAHFFTKEAENGNNETK